MPSRGLANMGCTCYMNSMIQAIAHARPMVKHFFSDVELCSDDRHQLSRELKSVLLAMWAPATEEERQAQALRTVVPKNLAISLAKVSSAFRRPLQQHDAHEWYSALVDHVAQEITPQHPQPPQTQNEACSSNKNKSAQHKIRSAVERAWSVVGKRMGAPNVSQQQQQLPDCNNTFAFAKIMHGTLITGVQCGNCDDVSYVSEAFSSLCVPTVITKERIRVAEMLKSMFQSEQIQGRVCDSCKKTCDATRTSHVWTLPDVLVLTFKRFDEQGNIKPTPVGIVAALDVEGLLHDLSPSKRPPSSIDPSSSSSSSHSSNSNTRNPNTLYRLVGVVSHSGGVRNGHYVAFTRRPGGTWHLHDDDHISVLPNGINDIPTSSIYLTVYERTAAAHVSSTHA